MPDISSVPLEVWCHGTKSLLTCFRLFQFTGLVDLILVFQKIRIISGFPQMKLSSICLQWGIYQKIQYIHLQASYPLPTHLSQAFGKLYELINCLIHTEEKNSEGK